VGEWNNTRIVVKNGRVEHWLNGNKVVEFQIGSAQMKSLISESKYKDISGFGEVRKAIFCCRTMAMRSGSGISRSGH
jgi:hypothetical protein